MTKSDLTTELSTIRGRVVPIPVGALAGGRPTRAEVRGRGWRRSSRGLFVPAAIDNDDVEQRIVEASAVVPDGCAITGWAALRWLGGRWFSGVNGLGERRPVTIAIGTHDIRPQPGIAVTGEGLQGRVIRVVDGVPVTHPRFAVSFEMRYAPSLVAAVKVLDMAAFNDLVSIDEQLQYMTPGQNGWTGIPRAREALGWADENSWSPMESVMRMVWIRDAGFRAPLTNRPVFDRFGRHLGTPDLIDPVSGVIGEYDGDDHLQRTRRNIDIDRESQFREVGLEPVTMTASDIRDPMRFVRRLTAAYTAASARGRRDRSWTLEAPPWWISTSSVSDRRALSSADAARLLRHRSA